MSDYNWCHGTNCHTFSTQSRVRGSGDNKVLRTIRIKENEWNKDHAFKYFCNQNCLYGFINLAKYIAVVSPSIVGSRAKIISLILRVLIFFVNWFIS